VGALTHWPGVARACNCGLREACDRGSERMAPVAADGPAFVTRISVKLVRRFGVLSEASPSVFEMETSQPTGVTESGIGGRVVGRRRIAGAGREPEWWRCLPRCR